MVRDSLSLSLLHPHRNSLTCARDSDESHSMRARRQCKCGWGWEGREGIRMDVFSSRLFTHHYGTPAGAT